MDNEKFSFNITENNDDIYSNQTTYEKTETSLYKPSLSLIRILTCTTIITTLALFKHFNYTNYKHFGDWYDTQFKIQSTSTNMIKDFTFTKLNSLQEKIKSKINKL